MDQPFSRLIFRLVRGPSMPALLAYVLAVGLFLGAGYGALTWLAAPEPVEVAATKTKHGAPRAETYGAIRAPDVVPADSVQADSAQAKQPEPARVASDTTQVSGAPTAGSVAAAIRTDKKDKRDKRYDAMARVDATPKPASPPAPVVKPIGSKAAIAAAAPEAVTAKPGEAPLPAGPDAKPEANSEPVGPAAAKIANVDREGRRIEPPRAKRSRIRQAEDRRHRRYETMTLRTIEFEDGHRETRLLPLRRQDDGPAFDRGDWGDWGDW
jgi:hypothetical protein